METQEILTSSIVDLTSLKDFFSSDKDSLIQLIGVYISDTAPRVDTLEECITNIDYEAVKNICHFLKSSLGLMGVKCLEEVANLEKLAQKKESKEIIKDRLKFIVPICRDSITEYKLILSRLEAL